MEIIRYQEENGVYHLLIGGIAVDGHYRLARVSVETDDPAAWLLAHQEEAQALIDVGQYDPEREARPDFDALAEKAEAEIEWLAGTIPLIDAMTLEELRGVLKRLAQENMETIKAWRYVLRRLA